MKKMSSPSSETKTILAVVVLYQRSLGQAPAMAQLIKWLDESQPLAAANFSLAHCLIYDNSSAPQQHAVAEGAPIDVFYDRTNGGTRAAYLHALRLAKAKDIPWILFVDHDTSLPADLLEAMDAANKASTHVRNICAFVPQIFDRGVQVSPARMSRYGRLFVKDGAWRHERKATTLTAISSGAVVRTQCLDAVLPVPTSFALDYLDHWLFREFQRSGGAIVVTGCEVQHSLSVQSMSSMNPSRYRNILAGELAFLQGDKKYNRAMHLLWHTVRSIKVTLALRRAWVAKACVIAFFHILRGSPR